MLEHYRSVGVDRFHVNVHLGNNDRRILDEVEAIVRGFGVPVASVTVGEWQSVLKGIYARSRAPYPDDWHILADQDEFQVYPMPLAEIQRFCEHRSYTYVSGCFVDRFAADGRLPAISSGESLWTQFPIAAFFSLPVAGADPIKVVMVKGGVDVVKGQHHALNGTPCPSSDAFVQVHHFKWVHGVVEDLSRRAVDLQSNGHPHFMESVRIVKHLSKHGGKADLGNPRFLSAVCNQDYPHWPLIVSWFTAVSKLADLGTQLRCGPSRDPGPNDVLWHRMRDIHHSLDDYASAILASRKTTTEGTEAQ
jgi:hypothetical protein